MGAAAAPRLSVIAVPEVRNTPVVPSATPGGTMSGGAAAGPTVDVVLVAGAAGTASAATSPAPATHAPSDVIRLPSAPATSANESVTHPSPSEERSTAAPRCTDSRVRITAQCDGLDIQPVIAARAVVISGLVTGNVCEAVCSVSLTFQSGVLDVPG